MAEKHGWVVYFFLRLIASKIAVSILGQLKVHSLFRSGLKNFQSVKRSVVYWMVQ